MRKLLLVSTAVLSLTVAHGQGTKIIVQNIDTGWKSTIMSYDYSSQIYDTLYSIPDTTVWFNEESAIDGFNGRYFFGASISGYPNYSILSFDITTKTLTPLFQMNFGSDQGIEYDCFTNSLIYRDVDSVKSFNLTSGTKSTICQVPNSSNALYAGFLRAYDYLNQRLVYVADITGNPSNTYFVTVDIPSGTWIDTTYVPLNGLVHYLTYDITTNSFYGITGNGTTSKIDPITGNSTTICAPPTNYGGNLNMQDAVFDSYNGFYLLPFYDNTNSKSKIAIVNINNSSIIKIDSLPDKSNFHRLYSMQPALLKLNNGVLLASYAGIYEWYLNNVLITGANSQTHIPTQTGNYTVKETHLDGRITTSNIVTVNSLGVPNDISTKNNLHIYPNPFSAQTVFQADNPFHNATLTVDNCLGQTVAQIKNISGQTITFNRNNLASGLYFVRLTADNNIYTDKLVITDK